MIKKDSLILLGFALTLSSIGCSKISNATDVQLSDIDTISEKENSEMVTFPISHFSIAMSSVPGQPIKLKLDNSSFECKIEHGSFEYYNDVKKKIVGSDEIIYYCPSYKKDGTFVDEYDTSFVDIVINDDNGIIGYAIVKIISDKSKFTCHPQLLVSNLFVDENNNVVNVDNDYLEGIMANYHNDLNSKED